MAAGFPAGDCGVEPSEIQAKIRRDLLGIYQPVIAM
jgi:hypothetical protein